MRTAFWHNPVVWTPWLVFALAAALRLHTIGAKEMWLDEAFSVWIADHSLLEGWRWLALIDQHPPLYYALLHGWQRLFGDLQGSVRTLSALSGALAIPFFYGAIRRFFDDNVGLIAALILAISPYHVRYGQETRMYALLTLAVAAAFYCLARVLVSVEPGRRNRVAWLGLAVTQAAVMLTHNSAAVFFPLALNVSIFVALWLRRRGFVDSSLPALDQPHFLRRWLLIQGIALLLWSPWALPFLDQARLVDREFWILAPTAQLVLDAFQHYNFAYLPTWLPAPWLWNLLYGLL
ncbi:MAG: phospholipid carrier-dependent glycosyltransferase, partial [Caldilineaceae bacterium]|nr:phospholipid carrier-dependent glycosyltransferase [Caldilineaceae bacterium]